MAYLGFSFCCGFGLAVFTSFAIWLSATLKLSCMQTVLLPICRGIELEKPEFDGPFRKGGMVIEHMVAAPVVMAAPAAVCTVAGVPDISKLRHRLRLPAV